MTFMKLLVVLEQVPRRDVNIVMGDMNAMVGTDNTGREEVMGRHGKRAEMDENGERWADFCQVNELVIGGTLFPHKVSQEELDVSRRWHRQSDRPYGI